MPCERALALRRAGRAVVVGMRVRLNRGQWDGGRGGEEGIIREATNRVVWGNMTTGNPTVREFRVIGGIAAAGSDARLHALRYMTILD